MTIPKSDDSILRTFQTFLDNEGFVDLVSESELIHSILPRYSYSGKTILEHTGGGLNWDGVNSCGWQTLSDEEYRFSASTSYIGNVIQTTFYTKVSLDGLTIPYEINIGDSVSEVLSKIGLSFDPTSNTLEWSDNGEVVLLSDSFTSLVLGDQTKNKGPLYGSTENASAVFVNHATLPSRFWIVFRESYTADNGNQSIRRILFQFDENGLFSGFRIQTTLILA